MHRIAIANSRIETFDGRHVVFRYRDNRSAEIKRCRLGAMEFVRRFLQHVLPRRFVKVRSYGLYSTSSRPALEKAQHMLASAGATADTGSTTDPAPDDSGHEPAEVVLRTCPNCGIGHMHIVAKLLPTFIANPPLRTRVPP